MYYSRIRDRIYQSTLSSQNEHHIFSQIDISLAFKCDKASNKLSRGKAKQGIYISLPPDTRERNLTPKGLYKVK